jgi:glycosyltransferase involved in cell wall biosynthesis
MRVVLVHDYLTQYGGAERVLEALYQHLPDATVYTSLYQPEHLPASWRSWDIRTSVLAHIPGSTRTHRLWLPLYPAIFGQIGRRIADADVAIADSSAWSHHARPTSGIPLICYCHSPGRFLYGDRDYLGATRLPGIARQLANGVFGALRWLDRRAARRVTRYIANSNAVRDRIGAAYGIDATVIHPPVDVERFRPAQPVEPEDWFLVVSRLVPHKWIDRAIRACTTANLPLKVIGSGRARDALGRLAGPTVEFLGERSDTEVVDHMQRCRALILPGVEDFGMTAVEAQAAGRPVIAAGAGGALESVIHGVTGLHFDPADDAALIAALHEACAIAWSSEAIQRNAATFSTDVFREKMDAVIAEVGLGGRGDPEPVQSRRQRRRAWIGRPGQT